MKKGQNTLSTWEYTKLMAKINFFGSIARMDKRTLRLRKSHRVHSVWLFTQSYTVFSCWAGRPTLQYPRATVPLPFPTATSFALGNKGEKRERKRREEKRREVRLGHTAVRHRRSSPKTGRDSVPFLVFPQFGSLPRCSWWFPHVCCNLGAIEGLLCPSPPRKRWEIVV